MASQAPHSLVAIRAIMEKTQEALRPFDNLIVTATLVGGCYYACR